MNVTFISGQNSTGDNQQCFYVVLLDDDILEYNETFDIIITPTSEDEQIVNVIEEVITVTVEEDHTDSKQLGLYNQTWLILISSYHRCQNRPHE